MFPAFRRTLLVALGVAIVAAAVFAVGERQRRAVDRSFQQSEGVHGMLTAMLDQETGLRGYLQTGDDAFLEPYTTGKEMFGQELRQIRRNGTELDAAAHAYIDRLERLGGIWTDEADKAIYKAHLTHSTKMPLKDALRRKAIMDEFRGANSNLERSVEAARRAALKSDQRLSVGLVITLAFLFAVGGWVFIGRPAEIERRLRHQDHRRRDLQGEFARTMQVMDGEQGAHAIVKRHLERALPDETRVVVLQRNNSADRLDATTPIRHQPLAEAVRDATPASCLAVRLGTQHHQQTSGGDALLECELCGKAPTELTTCTPLVVSGEVIGSVLVEHEEPLGRSGEQVIDDTVTQAAPVLANMRNLAIAESRASTDALTGLANRRAVQDTVRRMVAHAARVQSPMAVLALDIDHFKRINDRYGHDKGDDVLAAVGQTLAGGVRASDFVGRQGGEEFVALLPDTDLSGALVVAENLRTAIASMEPLGIAEGVTASIGVAVMPEDGNDPATLQRMADRALYAAKAGGRNRVETAASEAAQGVFTGGDPATSGA
jgi:diguanylate cyclase (GGDEF)-like protein